MRVVKSCKEYRESRGGGGVVRGQYGAKYWGVYSPSTRRI